MNQRTDDAVAAAVEDVSVDHGGADILVAQQLLHGPDVVAVFQQVGCKAVPESMAADRFLDTGKPHGLFHCPMQSGLVKMVPTDFAGTRVF